ncbi:MAG: hypothetical protein ACI4P8_02950 [Akkermansia sp.]
MKTKLLFCTAAMFTILVGSANAQNGYPAGAPNAVLLPIPPNAKAPALRHYYALTAGNTKPSPQDYQNLLLEYQHLVSKIQRVKLLTLMALQSGDFCAHSQYVMLEVELATLQAAYEWVLRQRQTEQIISE